MSKTRHIQKRMSQRGIQQSMVDMTLEYGEPQGDKVILNRKGIDCILKEIEKLKQCALKLRQKGGLVVVDYHNTLITSYALNSFRR
jgi:hypothetical protein